MKDNGVTNIGLLNQELVRMAEEIEANQAEIARLKQEADDCRDIARSLISQHLYICLKWLKCLEISGQKNRKGWAARAIAISEWFNVAVGHLPQSRDELKKELNKLKQKLHISPSK